MINLENFLKEAEKLKQEGFTLQCLSVVDELTCFRLCYFFCNFQVESLVDKKFEIEIERNHPEIPSLVFLWPGINWHEREAYDMFGILFKNHPDLRRILCEDDWIGFPLRKDYLPQEEYQGMKTYPDQKMNFEERFPS